MEYIFSFISGIPTYYYYIGGLILVILLYQRYDENHRYNSKSGPAPESPKPSTTSPQSPQNSDEKRTTAVEMQLNQQMIDFLKGYDPSKNTWSNWAFKKFFPEEILEDLCDSVRNGELKTGMKIKIQDGDWEIVKQ